MDNNTAQTNERVRISIVTATYNAASVLPRLIASLRAQTDKNFEWVVADGGSTDGTMSLLENADDLNIVISSHPDFGIYDAINRSIKLATSEYYIVMGADDYLRLDAIENYRLAAISCDADIITAHVMMREKALTVKEGKSWLYGMHGFISAHSVGALIRKNLHNQFGYYSRKFPIAADQLFITQACRGGATRYVASFIAGELGEEGVSSTDYLGTHSEFLRVQIMAGHNKFIQLFLFLIKIIRKFSRF